MAATGEHGCEIDASLDSEREIQMPEFGRKRGGWITFPFIMVTLSGMTIAAWGWLLNLVVYLIEEFNVKSITAAQISNVVFGFVCLFPVLGAIISDSYIGSFAVISISTFISLLGSILLTLTASLDSLRPQTCEAGSSLCKSPSKGQFAILYTAIALASIGTGGTRFTLSTAGANQFEKPKAQTMFFSWFFFVVYVSSIISATAIVYIEDNVSWKVGFGICVAANIVGSVSFLGGKRFYKHDKPQGSPFTGLVRVIVSATRKRNAPLTSRKEDYCYKLNESSDNVSTGPTKNLRFLNRAALKTEGDIHADGSIAKPWKLCTVQQVEDLKSLLKILPLWSTSLFLAVPATIQSSLTVLQALSMNRHLGPHFKIPAASMQVIILLSTLATLTPIDKVILPFWNKLTHQSPTLLQRIGIGHVLNILSMAVSAIVESKRLKIAHEHNVQDESSNSIVPMLALWLFPQLVLMGIAEAFHFPGNIAFFYKEFPLSLRSTATSMTSMIIGIAYYLGAALINVAQRKTDWLPDNINRGRMDNVYWTLAIAGVLNFGYFMVCAYFYKYRREDEQVNESSTSSLEK